MQQEAVHRMFAAAKRRRTEPSSSSSSSSSSSAQPAPVALREPLPPSTTALEVAPSPVDSGDSDNERLQPREAWFVSFPWLVKAGTDDTGKYLLGCARCMWAKEENLFLPIHKSQLPKATLASGNFHSKLKKGKEKLSKHGDSALHRHAEGLWIRKQIAAPPVHQIISTAASKQCRDNSVALLDILRNLRYLLGQGLAIRGHEDRNSNLGRLLNLTAHWSPVLKGWLERTPIVAGGEGPRWLSHRVVEEYIELFSAAVAAELQGQIREAKWYSLICDETTDTSVSQQVSVCVRFCSPTSFTVHEVFMAMVKTDSSTANSLKDHLVSFLEQNGLSICDLRGQGYDGCSTMSGCTSGVAVQMSALQPRAKYVHCSGHRLNLTLQDGIRNISNKESRSAFEDVLATCSAFSSFVRDSPKRIASLEIFCNKDGSRGRRLRPVCPTRWVLRVAALQALTSNYEGILEWLVSVMESPNYTSDMRGRASAFLGKFEDFSFYFCLRVLLAFFEQPHPTHKYIQSPSANVASVGHACLALKSVWEADSA